MTPWRTIQTYLSDFAKDDRGSSTIEFVIVFPIFFGFFLMTYESGMISLRHVMLEHGVDLTVRDVRIGQIPLPTVAVMRERICDRARIIPDCENQLRLEMIRNDPASWTPIAATVGCIDRGNPASTPSGIVIGGNNELMFLRVCVRIDPVMPLSVLGKAIKVGNDNSEAGGSYALVTQAAFVVEPFRSTGGGSGSSGGAGETPTEEGS